MRRGVLLRSVLLVMVGASRGRGGWLSLRTVLVSTVKWLKVVALVSRSFLNPVMGTE